MIIEEDNHLAHYGILRKSGRYPWGSGGESQRNRTFLDTIKGHEKDGMTLAQIAKLYSTDEHPITSTQLVALRSIATNEQKQQQINQANRLKERGWSHVKIGERMGGLNESTVRSLLAEGRQEKADVLQNTADMLRRQVAEKDVVQIGTGVELDLPIGGNPAAGIGISPDKLRTAVEILKEEGYGVHNVKVPQLGTGKETNVKVLAKPGIEWKDIKRDPSMIKLISEHSDDGGRNFSDWKPPKNISSKRVDVVYAEQGGTHKDGLIELRPGAKDLDMGASHYAQVRIAVDKTHYLKGMAVYNADLPDGVDVRFNTNKSDTGNKKDAMKAMEKGEDGKPNLLNPFSASIKPGGQRGALNIVNEEGDWDKQSKSLAAQMLSKQPVPLAKQQLAMTHERRREELDSIKAMTNPAVKRKMLETYADSTDSAAVHLKAAHMPGQATKVLLPIPQVKPTEVYAPHLPNGTRVSLVRYPHGGTFEIPELTVNNRTPAAKKLIGTNVRDAIGINHKTAEILSGADFDGDTALVIPNNRGLVKNQPPLKGLQGFDPRASYPAYDGMRTVDGGRYNAKTKEVEYPTKRDGTPVKPNNQMQKQMGSISNLITDMTIQGAKDDELARAVRHSMVVIDSQKHKLDFKSSAEANGIPALKKKYQAKPDGRAGGASTLLSRTTSDRRVPEIELRKARDGGPIDPKTGELVYVKTGKTYTDRKGVEQERLTKAPWGSLVKDAHTLRGKPDTAIEMVYADHANRLKALANEARKEYLGTKPIPYNKSAKEQFATEVSSLNAKLNTAKKNAPRERQAQVLGGALLAQRRQANPHMDADDVKKARNQSLAEARIRTGADKDRVRITDREWLAIQSGAISNHRLEEILANGDLDQIKSLAMPKKVRVMTPTKIARAKTMLASGYPPSEVAAQLGVPVSTLNSSMDSNGVDT